MDPRFMFYKIYTGMSENLAFRLNELRADPSTTDVTFVFGNERLHAHRVVLASSCEFFRALLYGNMAEAHQREIHLDVPANVFKIILDYVYRGQLTNRDLNEENAGQVFELAHQYELCYLPEIIISYLIRKVSVENAVWTREFLAFYEQHDYLQMCDNVIDQNAEQFLKHPTFNSINERTLWTILDRDSFHASEENIFRAVMTWLEHHPESNSQKVMSKIRLSLLDKGFLLKTVRRTGLVEFRLIDSALKTQHNKKKLPHRFFKELEIYAHYDELRAHYKLQHLFKANHIRAHFPATKMDDFNYYVEVSEDRIEWKRVVDYTKYQCSSIQNLYFPSTPMRYIRFAFTIYDDEIDYFSVNYITIKRVTEPMHLCDGLVWPVDNVACANMGATIVQPSNLLFNEDFRINIPIVDCVGRFIVRLGQPYCIGSIRMRFSRVFTTGIIIRTSEDGRVWYPVVENCLVTQKTWKHFTFEARTVMYIQMETDWPRLNIRVDLQCPSQDRNYLKEQKDLLSETQPL